MNRGRRPQFSAAISDPVLVGSVLIVLALVGMYLSYNSSRGLPFVPSYRVYANVPDAAELTRGVSEVKIGGSRVGLVEDVKAEQGRGGHLYARLKLALTKDVEPLPVDSVVEVRPRSILGAKYLDLKPGKSRRALLAGGTLPLRQARTAFEFSDAFEVFNHDTARDLRRAVNELGNGLAGRGVAFNNTVRSAGRLLPRLQRVTRVLASPRTELAGFVRGAAATTGALARVAPELGSLIDSGATTLAAIDAAGGALGESLEALPPTEAVATRTLGHALPVLDDADALVHGLRPAATLLPETTARLGRAVDAGIPVLRGLTGFYTPAGSSRRTTIIAQVEQVVNGLRRLAQDRSTRPAVLELIATVTTLRSTLRLLEPAQLQCNVGGIWARNVSQVVNGGDATGNWLNTLVIFDLDLASLLTGTPQVRPSQTLQSGKPDPQLHTNLYPNATAGECESGNEPYPPGQVIGNPPGRQSNSTETTSPPAGVRDLARRAGLVP